MGLVTKQDEFMTDVAKLITHIQSKDYLVTGGELYRPYDMQLLYYYGKNVKEMQGDLILTKGKKRSWTKSSKHLQRLAIDLNFFKPMYDPQGFLLRHELTYSVKDIKEFGDFWESLSENNVWGGRWKTPDTPHFQKLIK